MDKTLILNKIKSYLNIEKNIDFANFLEIKPTTLAMWYKRNTFDIELIFKKCEWINAEWLLTGQGNMLKENSNISIGRDNYGVNNTGDIDNNNDITINKGYTREQNKQDIADNQEHNNEIINLLKSQLKDKEEKEALLKDKIAELERKLELAELKNKEAMSAKIEIQRARLKAKKALLSEKDEIIFAQNNTINEQNEEINAMKSRYSASNDAQQIQPPKGI